MRGLGGLAQRLLRLGVPQTLWAGTEQSDASAEACGAAPEVPPWDWTLHPMLKPEFGCSRKRVHRQLRLAGIVSVRCRACKVTTNSRHSYPPAPNLLQRKFSFDQPNQAWVSDITYIPTAEGWLYLSIVKNLCTRKMVGYACSERTGASLTPETLHLAVRRCKPPKGFVFHSDRASSTPLGPSGSALSSLKFGRACPARAIPTTTP